MTPESSIAVVISVAIPEMSCTERLLMINERKTVKFHSFLLGTKETG
jgi:hypothetical protein